MKVILLTNILNPFRIYFYDLLRQGFEKNNVEFKVIVMAEKVPGRKWNYYDFERDYTYLLKGKVFVLSGVHIIINPDIGETIKKEKPDIMVCAGSYMLPSVWTALRLRKKLNYKILLWSESHLKELRDYSGIKLAVREKLRNIIFKKFDGFWYAGQMAREFVEKYARTDAEYIFVPNLVEERAYLKAYYMSSEEISEERKKWGIEENETFALCPARLSKVKGIPQFMELLKGIQLKDRQTLVIVVPGFGEMENEIRAIAKKDNINLKLIGFQNQDSMIKLYGASDFVLLPSLSDPNPLTCIEASWAGKPLLVSEHVGNHPEIVQEGRNGYVFRYDHPEESKQKIVAMINKDKSWFKEAGKLSQKIAKEKYNSEVAVPRVVKETINII